MDSFRQNMATMLFSFLPLLYSRLYVYPTIGCLPFDKPRRASLRCLLVQVNTNGRLPSPFLGSEDVHANITSKISITSASQVVMEVKIFMRWFQTALEIGKLVRDFRLIRLITPTKWRMGSVCSEGKIPQSHIWIARSTCSRASPRTKPSLWVPEFPHGYPKLRFGPPPVNPPPDGRFGWCPD